MTYQFISNNKANSFWIGTTTLKICAVLTY